MLNGLPVTGVVRSVREDTSITSMRWIVSVVPNHSPQPKSDFSPAP
jgi:hypothetical protein